MSGAFGSAAVELHAHGLRVIPCKGKEPVVRGWAKWQGQARETVEAFARKHPDANVGVICGLSRLTVIDADDENALADAEARFGRSPLVMRTPRGGGHIYFASSGERNADLRREGLNVDVRGAGGMVLAPPSVRAGGGSYRIERGSWDDLGSLPQIAPGSLGSIPSRNVATPGKKGGFEGQEGRRNNGLFSALRTLADASSTLPSLLAEAHAINSQFTPPLPRAEVEKVARSVWSMKQEGRLILPGQQRIFSFPDELDSLGADAFYLLTWLKRWHGARTEPFALSVRAMEKAQSIPGWGRWRYAEAINRLVAGGFIYRNHRGGSKRGDPSLYSLAANMGLPIRPNITYTLPSASPACPEGLTVGICR